MKTHEFRRKVDGVCTDSSPASATKKKVIENRRLLKHKAKSLLKAGAGKSADVNNYKKIYQQFAAREDVFSAITGNVKTYILPDKTISGLIPEGTAVENALTSYLTEWEIHRDYFHLSDFSRVVASYAWYCILAEVEQLEKIKLDAIPVAFLNSAEDKAQDRPLTQWKRRSFWKLSTMR